MPELLAWNWNTFEKLNAIAHQVPALDPLFRFGANDALFLSPLIFVILWVGLAQWSPFFRHERQRLGEQVISNDRRLGLQLVLLTPVAIVLALVGTVALGDVINEPRPFISHPAQVILLVSHPADASFPSDHETFISAAGMMLVFYVALLLKRVIVTGTHAVTPLTWSHVRTQWGRISLATTLMGCGIILMVFIGLSRVVVGVHYPLDILGGFGVGTLSSAIVTSLRPSVQKFLDGMIHLAERVHLA